MEERSFTKIKIIITSIILLFSGQILAQEENKIVIATNDWTSQVVLSHVLKNIYEEIGEEVELKEMPIDRQWGEIARGWVHVQIEVWEGTMADKYERLIKSGKVIAAGTHDAVTREEWWYPDYVEKMCPGLPDWKALKKCSHVFKNKYIGGPWEKPDKARVRALGLDFKIDRVKKGDDLWVKLEKAYKNKEPIILFNWTPNWVEAKFKGSFVNFPDYDKKCETDPTWGISKKWKYDCGNPKNGWLKKIAWKGMEKKWPCAVSILNNFNLNNEMISSASAYVDYDKLSHQEAAKKWMSKNKKVWSKWIPKTCKR